MKKAIFKRTLFVLGLISMGLSLLTLSAYYSLDQNDYCRPSDVLPFAIDCGDQISGFLTNLFNPFLFLFQVIMAIQSGLGPLGVTILLLVGLAVNTLMFFAIFCLIGRSFNVIKRKLRTE